MQPWGALEQGQRLVVTGVSGTGKTTFASRLVASAWRVLWLDPEGELAVPGRLSLTVTELERWPALLDDPHMRLVVWFESDDEEGQGSEVTRLVTLLMSRCRDAVVVMEEVGDYRRWAEAAINKLFRKGRKRGLVPVLCSQVQTDLPLTARKQATDAYLFAQVHESELNELERVYGTDARRRVEHAVPYRPTHWVSGRGVVE